LGLYPILDPTQKKSLDKRISRQRTGTNPDAVQIAGRRFAVQLFVIITALKSVIGGRVLLLLTAICLFSYLAVR